MKIKLLISIFVFLLIPFTSYADNWFPVGSPTTLTPVVSTWGIKIPSLPNAPCIATDASGIFEIGTCSSGGTPGGANTQVQFNNSGSFGGVPGFTFNKTTSVISSITGITSTTTTGNDFNIFSGQPTGATDNGNNIEVQGSDSGATSGNAGGIFFRGGEGHGVGLNCCNGGAFRGIAGTADDGLGNIFGGADFTFPGGDTGNQSGGNVELSAGNMVSGTGSGGTMLITGGNAQDAGSGGGIRITGGNGGVSSGDGGNIVLVSGSTNTGTAGFVQAQDSANNQFRVDPSATAPFVFSPGATGVETDIDFSGVSSHAVAVIPNIGGTTDTFCFQTLGNCTGTSAITALGNYSTTTGTQISFSTTTTPFNGLTFGQTILVSANGLLFTPTVIGTLNNAGLTNSSITITANSPLTGGGTPSLGGSTSLGCQTASGSQAGCLSSADWTTFNNKQSALTASFPIILSGSALSFGGLTTSTPAVIGNIPYFSGVNTFANVATTSVTCSGGTSCTSFTAIGGSPITISSTAGSAFPFTPATNFNQAANATTTQIWFQGSPISLSASNTAQFANSSTTIATFGTLYNSGITSALGLFGSDHKEGAYGGTTCTNQFVRSLNGAGAATCNTVSLTADVTGVLPIANGGTNASAIGSHMLLAFNGTSVVSTSTPTANSYLATSSTATSSFNGQLIVGATSAHPYLRVGSTTCPQTNVYGLLEVCGNDNSTGGVEWGSGNIAAGTASYLFQYFNNDLATANNSLNYAGFQYNSSKYSDTSFGTAVATSSQFSMWNTAGPETFIASTSTWNGYISFLVGGSAASNEKMRISNNGNITMGSLFATTTPLPLAVTATHALGGTGGFVTYFGDSVIANSNAVTYSYKSGASTGASAVLGFNAFIDTGGTSRVINTISNGWEWKVDNRDLSGSDNAAMSFDRIMRDTTDNNYMTIMGTGQQQIDGTAPTSAFGTGAGTSPTLVSIKGSSNFITFSMKTGTTPSGSNATVATITLPSSCASATVPVISDANSNADALGIASLVFASSTAANAFTINSGSTALVASTNYIWNIFIGCY